MSDNSEPRPKRLKQRDAKCRILSSVYSHWRPLFLGREAADNGENSAAAGETKRVRWAVSPPVRQNVCRIQRMKDNPTIDANWNKASWNSVTPVTLEYYMGEEPAHQPKAQARVAYDDHNLYIIWKVDDKYVLGKRTQHQQDVWRDSCVESSSRPIAIRRSKATSIWKPTVAASSF